MKILTQNVKVFFECENDCPNSESVTTDVPDLIESGTPICPICNERMTLGNECLITN